MAKTRPATEPPKATKGKKRSGAARSVRAVAVVSTRSRKAEPKTNESTTPLITESQQVEPIEASTVAVISESGRSQPPTEIRSNVPTGAIEGSALACRFCYLRFLDCERPAPDQDCRSCVSRNIKCLVRRMTAKGVVVLDEPSMETPTEKQPGGDMVAVKMGGSNENIPTTRSRKRKLAGDEKDPRPTAAAATVHDGGSGKRVKLAPQKEKEPEKVPSVDPPAPSRKQRGRPPNAKGGRGKQSGPKVKGPTGPKAPIVWPRPWEVPSPEGTEEIVSLDGLKWSEPFAPIEIPAREQSPPSQYDFYLAQSLLPEWEQEFFHGLLADPASNTMFVGLAPREQIALKGLFKLRFIAERQ